MELTENMRYFIVFYYGAMSGTTITGNITIETTNNLYINRKRVTEMIKERKEHQNSNLLGIDMVLTNIIELNKADYDNWQDNTD